MRKYVFGVLGALTLITLIIMTQIPAALVEAKEDSGFTIQNGTLVSYNGIETEVSIPGNVTVIGAEAFQNKKLTRITIPSSVERIEHAAFYGCKNLSSVTLEEGVRAIGTSAFSMCEKLDQVAVPASVTQIGAGAFSGCTSLESITVSPYSSGFFCNDGVLYNQDSTKLIQYLAGRKSTSYEMPFTVKTIEPYAFWGAGLLTRVEISNNVKGISPYSFTNCESLTDVFIPESVTKLDSYAFSDCTSLKSVSMESDAVKVDDTAFQNCSDALETKTGVSRTEWESAGKSGAASSAAIFSDTADTSTTAGGISTDTTSTDGKKVSMKYQKSPVSTIKKSSSIDMKSPAGLIGASRIVGGNALVILDDSKTKTVSHDFVSKNTISRNTTSKNTILKNTASRNAVSK